MLTLISRRFRRLVDHRVGVVAAEEVQDAVDRQEPQLVPGAAADRGGLLCGDLGADDDVAEDPQSGECPATSGGRCTLRAAIMECNNVSSSCTLVLLSGSTYTLTIKGAGEDDSLTGDLDINARGVVIIKNSGTGAAIVQGGNGWNDRIFHVRSTLGGVTIDGIQIQNGHADTPGGGIRQDCCVRLIVRNSTVSGNVSPSGGGIASGSIPSRRR